MMQMEKSSQFTPSEAANKAVEFFGSGGLDLEMTECAECCVRLGGGGGTVFVQAAEDKKRERIIGRDRKRRVGISRHAIPGEGIREKTS